MSGRTLAVVLFAFLKGHGNEADFLGSLQKLVPHRYLTLPFEPFRYWLRIRGDIRNRKTTRRLGESLTLRLGKSLTLRLGESTTRQVGESAFECLKENSESWRVGDSPTWRVANSPTRESGSRYLNFLKFIIDFSNFKRLFEKIVPYL